MDQASAMLQAMYPGRVAPNFLPMLPRWDWLAQQLGTKPAESKALAGPHEIRLEKRRRRKRDRMLYNFWIPLLLGTPRATAATMAVGDVVLTFLTSALEFVRTQ